MPPPAALPFRRRRDHDMMRHCEPIGGDDHAIDARFSRARSIDAYGFVNAASQLRTTVIGGTVGASTTRSIKNRPSGVAAYGGIGLYMGPIRAGNRTTGAPASSWPSEPTAIGTAVSRSSGAR